MISKKVPAVLLTIITAVFSFIVCKVDVGYAGNPESKIGLVHLNQKFFEKLGGTYNDSCYQVSKYLGYAAFVIVAFFAMVGLVQLIKRRSLLKVDKRIIGLGILYIVTLGMYALFTKVSINYRPVIVPPETALEPSFPSSHTVLVVVVCGSAMILINEYVKSKGLAAVLKAIMAFGIAGMISYRTFANVHWITDIIAGLLFAFTLILWYEAFTGEGKIKLVDKEAYMQEQKRKEEKRIHEEERKNKQGGKHFKKLSR